MTTEQKTLDLGFNPVDMTYAFRAAVESSLDVVSAIIELAGNCADYSNNFAIILYGSPEPKNPDLINLKKVKVEDDGCGMDHATVFERFRGAYYHSTSHGRTDMSGRNGVGVKTNLQYWKEIRVETTTKGLIPSEKEWKCQDEHRSDIHQTHNALSTLKPGDPDIELRSYNITIERTIANTPWEKVPHDQSGTTIYLEGPRQHIQINHKILLQRLSHMIEHLDSIRHPNNSIRLIVPNINGKAMDIQVKPFMKNEQGKDLKSLAHIKGTSSRGLNIIWENSSGTQPPKQIPEFKQLDDIEIDVHLLSENLAQSNEFVLCICGANTYETSEKRQSSVNPTINFLLGQGVYSMAYGFGYRLHGYVKTNDERLKKALRHNKSALDLEDKYAQIFVKYLHDSVLKPLNEIYVGSQKDNSVELTQTVQDLIATDLQNILTKQAEKARIKNKEGTTENESNEPQHREYRCNECELIWKVPVDCIPTYCCEFNEVAEKQGCGARDISRNTHDKKYNGEKNLRVQYIDKLGGFMPARYEPNENTVYLATYHPAFITDLTGQKKEIHDTTVGVEQSLFAIAIYRTQTSDVSFQDIYGQLLRCWYETRNDAKKLKAICRRVWKEKNITFEEI